MLYTRKLESLLTLLDPQAVAAWLDEVDRHRRRPHATSTAIGPSPDSERLLDVKEVCLRLSVKPSWVYEKTRQGAMPHVRVGTYVRFRWADIER